MKTVQAAEPHTHDSIAQKSLLPKAGCRQLAISNYLLIQAMGD